MVDVCQGGGPRGFNPLPPPKRGETERGEIDRLLIIVSIHSPRRSEGRPSRLKSFSEGQTFQSTPPAEARGDDFLQAHGLHT